ncbi:MAG: hypothetical protein PHE33_02295 [Bacteroidales bacterium]|nr:hypothetical protein [Bacteroidales bacterium]
MISIFFVQLSIGQETDSLPLGLTLISQANQGNSYLTFPTDIGNIEPLWFEGNLIPNFYIRQSKNSRLMAVLTPQIIVRMYRDYSYPVRTPSYIPQVTFYYLSKSTKLLSGTAFYGRLAHHSNGQDGDFFLENSEINVKSGDFSTNFFEIGVLKTGTIKRLNSYQFFKSSVEIHPEQFSQSELDGIYSRYRWHNAFSIFKLSSSNEPNDAKKPSISLKCETTWMFGNYNQLNTWSAERFNLSLTFYYHPKFMEDIGLFIQYYHGSDYYNMYFNHRLDMLRFGIMTEKLRF